MKVYIIVIEIILISFLIFRVYKLSKSYKKLGKEKSFIEKVETVLSESLPKPVAMIVTREITMFYYLFSRKSNKGMVSPYSYHKNVGYKGILIVLLTVILLESVGLFFLFHKWSPLISWIHVVLNVYGVLYLISDYRAIVQLPILLQNSELFIRVGSRRQITIPLNQIASINGGGKFFEEKKNKDVFKGVLLEFDTPQFEITLKQPITTTGILGKKQEIMKVYMTVDDKEKFRRALSVGMGRLI
ncbi:hypothetical protein ACFFF5_06065 [Lederbergia wuyishanensis]|uniref:Uncharacterized protein n=1 Tax=Lederbergia wuyishanensis TaxID=1347903 RepID=A0ABU0D315_9BACI|nr:hypothetical protein [Lederbergia wuyishanensis]MCJ8007053.1 hypothetical protein [Lederbergia wuyishanensis]MDQ0342803.1 hypothetical protein [Lederbergia wuyishanensis]